MRQASRDLVWDGCINVRDLGGLPLEGGGETRWLTVVRADSVRQLSDDGWRALADYGVERIVDLRFNEELEADPPREVAAEVVHVPLFGRRDEVDEIHALVDQIDDPVEHRRTNYLACLERFPANFAAAIAAVAQPAAGPVVVHCAGGIDRTGLVSALLLRLAGVEREGVAEDYAQSARNFTPFMEGWIDEAPTDEERRWRRIWSEIPARVMLEVLAELERRHGDVRGYLRVAGVTQGDLDALVERLRG